jgi:hypothetical protein
MKKEFATRYNYIIFKLLFLTTRVRDTSFHCKSLERFAELKNSGVKNLGRIGEDTNLGQRIVWNNMLELVGEEHQKGRKGRK